MIGLDCKVCTGCKTLKSLAAFYRKTGAGDGRMSECKSCCDARKGGGTCIECPICGCPSSRVVDSRTYPERKGIRRRRKCDNGHRFGTWELPDGAGEPEEQSVVEAMRTLVRYIREKEGLNNG